MALANLTNMSNFTIMRFGHVYKSNSTMPNLAVAGEIRELTKLINSQNNIQEIRKHVCDITKKLFWLYIEKYSKVDLVRKTRICHFKILKDHFLNPLKG